MRAFRYLRGLSQNEVARHVGISQGSYSLIERGFLRPDQEKAEKIAKLLKVPRDSIFPEEDD